MDSVNDIADALTAVIRLMVDEPGKLQVLAEPHGHGYIFRINHSSSDLGKLIGKNGRTARAIRTIVGVIGKSQNADIAVDIGNGAPLAGD